MKVLFVDSVHPSLQEKLESNNFVCQQELSLSKSEMVTQLFSEDAGEIHQYYVRLE